MGTLDSVSSGGSQPNTLLSAVLKATGMVDTLWSETNSFTSDLSRLASSALSVPTIMVPSVDTTAPTLSPSISAPAGVQNLPAAPALGQVAVPDISALPVDTTGSVPTLSLPAAPVVAFGVAPTTPSIGTVDLPTFSAPALPDAPDVSGYSLPADVSVSLPPELEPVPPVAWANSGAVSFSYSENRFSTAIMDTAVAKLLGDLVDGTYGIDDEVEQRLWQRARDRELGQANQAAADVSLAFATRGWPVPQGAMLAGMQRAQGEALQRLADTGREIYTKRADLYVEGRKFTYEQVRQYQAMLYEYMAGFYSRALDAAKAGAQFMEAQARLEVERYNAALAAYREYVAGFQARLAAANVAIEAFRAKLQRADVDARQKETQARVYAAMLDGVRTLTDVFKTRVEAARIAMELEHTKVGIYTAQVQGYATAINAERTKVDTYTAQVNAQRALAEVYDTSVRAYATKVQAAKLGYDAKLAAAQLEMDNVRLKLSEYTTQAEVALRTASTEASVYGTEVQAITALDGLRTQAYATKVNAQTSVANLQVQAAKTSIDAKVAAAQVAAEAAKAGASVYGSAMAGAMSSVHAQLSDAYSTSLNFSHSYDEDVKGAVDSTASPASL